MTTTPTTEIEAGAEALIVGDCAEARGALDLGGAFVATRIERKDEEACGGLPPRDEDDVTEIEFHGSVETRPAGGLLGEWMISGKTVIVAEITEFDDEGEPMIGSCVEVEGFVRSDGAIMALSVEIEDSSVCASVSGDDPPEDEEIRGVVESVPALGLIGQLVVSGVVVEATAETEIKTETGPLVLGACVKAEGFSEAEGVFVASEIKVLPQSACDGSAQAPSIEFTGRIESAPALGLLGEWRIAGRTVIVNAGSRFRLELGPAEPGVCVTVKGSPSAAGVVARQIRVTGGSCDSPPALGVELSFEGRVQAAPESGVEGSWRVSGRTVIVDSSTEVELDGAVPEPGLCVRVTGEATAAGVYTASRLVASDDDCGFGPRGPRREVELTGRVQATPADGNEGSWTIADLEVLVSAMTEIDDAIGAGSCVEVEGTIDENGALVAGEIETADEAECEAADPDGTIEFTGLVTSSPADAQLVGEWRISGFTVVAAEETEFDETDGPLGVGACVEVEGAVQADGSVAASKIDVESASGLCIRGVVHSASFEAKAVSPGQIVSIFGLGVGPAAGLGLQVANGRVQTNLQGLRVTFDGDAAPILFASATQINVVAPYSIEGKSQTRVRVEWAGGFSQSFELAVQPTSPGILTLTQTGDGQAAALNVAADGSVTVNGSGNPARPGQIVTLFATGEGQTNPPGVDGQVVAGVNPPRPESDVTVTIGGQAATVLYAGGAPGLVSGVLQVNVEIPADLAASGDVEVILTIGGVQSAAGVTLAVQN